MAHVIIATWVAKAEEAEYVAHTLTRIAPEIRAEPKTLEFQAQRRTDDPLTFVLYERYPDPSGYADHASTQLFKDVVIADLIPRLAQREVQTFTSFAD
ncbi:putative quinol monooxygenase [Brevibacterium oceani]|uniref:putative quinol monooxygenase n=1 Tax=Brevibacterium oceani TaxID=358099 RepID=UPI001B319597|nr:antibiotic biosynthesis monooxygenase [Brevibacterium oceani]